MNNQNLIPNYPWENISWYLLPGVLENRRTVTFSPNALHRGASEVLDRRAAIHGHFIDEE